MVKLRFHRVKKLSINTLSELLLFLYLCIPFITFVGRAILSKVGLGSLARPLALAVTYIPLLFLTIYLKRFLIKDFLILFCFIIIFFLFSFLIHPEYEYWYTRTYYGVWDYVLRPDNGLYIYLFIRLVNDPKTILKSIRNSAWPMYLYFGYRLLNALQQGYWLEENSRGAIVHMSYNLSFGYDILLFALTFLYTALEEKKAIDWLGAIVGLIFIITGGSRGPVLDIGIFAVLYILMKMKKTKKRFAVIGFLSIFAIIFYFTYDVILLGIIQIMDNLNLPSRFFVMLLSGDISDTNGRDVIWRAAVEMIEKKPFGYGAMGARHVIGNIHIVGHPHQFFLEVLIDFGVVFGSLIIVYFVYKTVEILRLKDFEEWQGVFIVFLARACQLLVSLTYWHSIGLWGVLAVGVCINKARKRQIVDQIRI